MRYLPLILLILLAPPVLANQQEQARQQAYETCIKYAEIDEKRWEKIHQWNKQNPGAGAERYEYFDRLDAEVWQEYQQIFVGKRSSSPTVLRQQITHQRQWCKRNLGL